MSVAAENGGATLTVPDNQPDVAVSVDSPTGDSPKPAKKYGFWKRVAYQKLKGWRPVLAAHHAEIFFIAAAVLCLALGIPVLIASLDVVEYRVRYDDAGPLAGLTDDQRSDLLLANADNGIVYNVPITVTETMNPPIYVVFELGMYFQNYRRYVRSYDPNQLHDGTPAVGVSACEPFQYVGDAENASLPENGAVNPCGQIANSNFNDTFSVTVGGQPLAIDDSNIAWSTDADNLYGDFYAVNYNNIPAYRGGNTTDLPLDQSEHFMVWMRPGGKKGVEKLFGQINTAIPAGTTVEVQVTNRYNTYGWSGRKAIILTTNSWVGGKNMFLPILYLVVSGLSFLTALGFFLGYDAGLIKKREFGNLDDMSWNQPDKELQAAEEYRAKQAKLRKKAASQKQKSGVSASVVPAQ